MEQQPLILESKHWAVVPAEEPPRAQRPWHRKDSETKGDELEGRRVGTVKAPLGDGHCPMCT